MYTNVRPKEELEEGNCEKTILTWRTYVPSSHLSLAIQINSSTITPAKGRTRNVRDKKKEKTVSEKFSRSILYLYYKLCHSVWTKECRCMSFFFFLYSIPYLLCGVRETGHSVSLSNFHCFSFSFLEARHFCIVLEVAFFPYAFWSRLRLFFIDLVLTSLGPSYPLCSNVMSPNSRPCTTTSLFYTFFFIFFSIETCYQHRTSRLRLSFTIVQM